MVVEVVIVKTKAQMKANRNKNRRLKRLAAKHEDIARIKKIKSCGDQIGDYQFLVEWYGPYEDNWTPERFPPNQVIARNVDVCIKFVTRRHKWEEALFELQ